MEEYILKRKKIILFLTFTFGLLFMIGSPNQASAATHSLRVFPHVLRHTWYHYDGNGRYDRITFGYKRYIGHYYYDGWNTYYGKIHYRNLHATKVSHHPNWAFATPVYAHHMHWTNVYGWNQGAGDGEYYGVKVRHYHGIPIRVLNDAGGAEIWTSQHYYATKKVARNLGNKHFKGVLYYPSY